MTYRVVADKTSSNGVANYVDVNANASPDIDIVLDAGSVVSAGVGNVMLNVESDNIATATGSSALPGIPAPSPSASATATVGGTINVSLAGTTMHQGDLTLELGRRTSLKLRLRHVRLPLRRYRVSTDAVVNPTISMSLPPAASSTSPGSSPS